MEGTTSTASQTTATTLTGKELKKKYGVNKKPLLVSSKATAFRRSMNFDEQFKSGPNVQVTYSWVVIDPELVHPTKDPKTGLGNKGTLIRANTYNGGLGEKVDYLNAANCRGIPSDDKELRKCLKHTADGQIKKDGYHPIPLSEVPFIEVAPAPEKTEEGSTPTGDSQPPVTNEGTTPAAEVPATPADPAQSEQPTA